MTRERTAALITVFVLAAALAVGVTRKHRSGTWQPPEPQDTIYAMLNAARAGDIKNYLASFTGEMESALRQSLAESGDAGFANYLEQSNAGVMGIAVSELQRLTETQWKVRVEYIFQDRNQAQTMYLEKTNSGWKIARTDSEERVKTLVPYGTPVK